MTESKAAHAEAWLGLRGVRGQFDPMKFVLIELSDPGPGASRAWRFCPIRANFVPEHRDMVCPEHGEHPIAAGSIFVMGNTWSWDSRRSESLNLECSDQHAAELEDALARVGMTLQGSPGTEKKPA